LELVRAQKVNQLSSESLIGFQGAGVHDKVSFGIPARGRRQMVSLQESQPIGGKL